MPKFSKFSLLIGGRCRTETIALTVIFSQTVLEDPYWVKTLSGVFKVLTTASDMNKIPSSIRLRRTIPPLSIMDSKSNFSLTQILSFYIE